MAPEFEVEFDPREFWYDIKLLDLKFQTTWERLMVEKGDRKLPMAMGDRMGLSSIKLPFYGLNPRPISVTQSKLF